MSNVDDLKKYRLELVREFDRLPPDSSYTGNHQSDYTRLKRAISTLDATINNEESKERRRLEDAHKKRKELMRERYNKLNQMLDRLENKRLAGGTKALEIERERSRRAEIDREIQSLINENDAQDRADLDGLLDELRSMATGGLE